MRKMDLTKNYIVIPTAVFCCLLWGSAFPCVKIGYTLFNIPSNSVPSQILFAGLRFSLAGIMVILSGSIMKKKFLLPKKEYIPKILKLSSLQTVIQYIFFYIGLGNTSGVKASVIESSNVFIALIFSGLIFRQEKIKLYKWIGCLIGFIGAAAINIGNEGLDFNFKFNGEGFIFISAAAYACSSVLMKEYNKNIDPVLLSGWQFFFGGIIMIICGAAGNAKIDAVSPKAFIMLIYLAFVSSAAYTLWGVLLKYNPVSKISVIGFTNPVFGVLLSAILLGESDQAFRMESAFSLLLICTGIYIVNKNFERKELQ